MSCATPRSALARALSALLPAELEVTGLLALLLLTDARRAARTDDAGQLVLLAEQDRGRYDPVLLAEGEALLEGALRTGRPGPYQVQAAIAACHSTARHADDTDWREIAALYGELLRYDPNPVHEANRAVAVAIAEGPAAGLVILDAVAHHPQLARWPTLHVARADLLHRLGRTSDTISSYQTALQLDPGPAERAFIQRRLHDLHLGPPRDQTVPVATVSRAFKARSGSAIDGCVTRPCPRRPPRCCPPRKRDGSVAAAAPPASSARSCAVATRTPIRTPAEFLAAEVQRNGHENALDRRLKDLLGRPTCGKCGGTAQPDQPPIQYR